MKTRRIIRLAGLSIAALAVFYWFTSDGTKQRLISAIEKAAADPEAVFRMADVVDFEWTALYVFGPYTSPDQVEAQLQIDWPATKRSSIEISDSVCLLVFMDGDKVVEHLDFPRNYDFLPAADSGRILKQDAIFRAERVGYRISVFLVSDTQTSADSPIMLTSP